MNSLAATPGLIFRFNERADLSVGFSLSLTGNRLGDWNLIARLNYIFGGRWPS